jgi:Flp pilus assembly CpaF family ATPase
MSIEASLLGPLADLLADELVTNIDCNGCDEVWLTHADGSVARGPAVADTDEDLVKLIRGVATYVPLSSRAFDPSTPWLDLALPDGTRICALMSVSRRPLLSIRCFHASYVQLADLHAAGAMSDEIAAFLAACVAARMNLVISGETFAGKTTMLRALGNEIGPDERIVTVEHLPELRFGLWPARHPNVVELEERTANVEGEGRVSLADLVVMARRLNPDRLIVGEVLGPEIAAMLSAMGQGEDGSLSTLHARDAASVPDRIVAYALAAGQPTELTSRLLGHTVDFVVHLRKTPTAAGSTHRWVHEIREILGYDGQQIISNAVFATPARDPAVARSQSPVSDARSERLAGCGYDQQAWARPRLAGVGR